MLTGPEPPFEEALDYLQFVYTADRVGAYVAPASTVLAQSVIAEGDKIFPGILSHLRRMYPEVYGPAVYLGWVPVRREFLIGEDVEVLSSGNLSINSFGKLGTYAGRFDNFSTSIAILNKPSPILTNISLDTPQVGPKTEPLE